MKDEHVVWPLILRWACSDMAAMGSATMGGCCAMRVCDRTCPL